MTVAELMRILLDDERCRRRSVPGDEGRVERLNLVEETRQPQIRMANLAIVGSHSTNGVAKVHSELLRKTVVKDLAEMFPERFNNKTNGVTPRRWLPEANPALRRLITDAIGASWITDLALPGHTKYERALTYSASGSTARTAARSGSSPGCRSWDG